MKRKKRKNKKKTSKQMCSRRGTRLTAGDMPLFILPSNSVRLFCRKNGLIESARTRVLCCVLRASKAATSRNGGAAPDSTLRAEQSLTAYGTHAKRPRGASGPERPRPLANGQRYGRMRPQKRIGTSGPTPITLLLGAYVMRSPVIAMQAKKEGPDVGQGII